MSPVARLVERGILFYQRSREGRPSPCRFQPSCSSYALEAVRTRGARRGSWLAARRIVRCNPWGGSGWDPVPDDATPHPDHHHHHRTAA